MFVEKNLCEKTKKIKINKYNAFINCSINIDFMVKMIKYYYIKKNNNNNYIAR